MNRLEAITSATDNLNRCVRERGKLTAQGDRWGVTLGECDWLEELHRLLYEENIQVGHLNDMYAEPYNGPRVAEEIDGRQIARDAIAAARKAHEQQRASEAKGAAFGMGGPELTVGPNPNTSRGQADMDREPFVSLSTSTRAVVVEDACKAFAKNEISGDEFERRVRPGAGPGSADDRRNASGAPAIRTITGMSDLRGVCVPRLSLDLVPDSLDRQEHRVVMHPLAAAEIMAADDRKLGLGGAPTRATTLPTTPAERKKYPVASGFMDYFPDAIAAVSNLSYIGNEQHNPGQPLNWARGKSTDEADTMMRHFLQRGTIDTDGVRHSVKMVWRALAFLQKEIEAETPAQR